MKLLTVSADNSARVERHSLVQIVRFVNIVTLPLAAYWRPIGFAAPQRLRSVRELGRPYLECILVREVSVWFGLCDSRYVNCP